MDETQELAQNELKIGDSIKPIRRAPVDYDGTPMCVVAVNVNGNKHHCQAMYSNSIYDYHTEDVKLYLDHHELWEGALNEKQE